MRIFILEDNDLRARAMRRALERNGHTVTIAPTYDDALRVLTSSTFDIVYLDHDLGGKRTGLDVARAIVSMPEDERPLEIVVHSANPVGARAIFNTLRDAGIAASLNPFLRW